MAEEDGAAMLNALGTTAYPSSTLGMHQALAFALLATTRLGAQHRPERGCLAVLTTLGHDKLPVRVPREAYNPRVVEPAAIRGPERVNDFATPGDINLVCGRRDRWSVFSPPVVG